VEENREQLEQAVSASEASLSSGSAPSSPPVHVPKIPTEAVELARLLKSLQQQLVALDTTDSTHRVKAGALPPRPLQSTPDQPDVDRAFFPIQRFAELTAAERHRDSIWFSHLMDKLTGPLAVVARKNGNCFVDAMTTLDRHLRKSSAVVVGDAVDRFVHIRCQESGAYQQEMLAIKEVFHTHNVGVNEMLFALARGHWTEPASRDRYGDHAHGGVRFGSDGGPADAWELLLGLAKRQLTGCELPPADPTSHSVFSVDVSEAEETLKSKILKLEGKLSQMSHDRRGKRTCPLRKTKTKEEFATIVDANRDKYMAAKAEKKALEPRASAKLGKVSNTPVVSSAVTLLLTDVPTHSISPAFAPGSRFKVGLATTKDAPLPAALLVDQALTVPVYKRLLFNGPSLALVLTVCNHFDTVRCLANPALRVFYAKLPWSIIYKTLHWRCKRITLKVATPPLPSGLLSMLWVLLLHRQTVFSAALLTVGPALM
jgi:hypothetical protein